MKKNEKSRILNVITRIFNVRSWLDFDRLKAFTLYLVNGFKQMFIPQKKEAKESFEQALNRLNIDEKDLDEKKKSLYRLSLLMCSSAAVIFIYMSYQMVFGGIKAVILSFILMLIALVLAFKYHFWYFQIKERKLGCSIAEWYKQGFMGEKP